MSRVLLRGAQVITMVPGRPDAEHADVLVDGARIAAIGENIEAPDAEDVDFSGRILIPGLVNAHLHTWQTALRSAGADWTLMEYLTHLHGECVGHYTPADMHISNLAGALNQINCGTTTVGDWCHNALSPEHADAAVEGLAQAGIRAVPAASGSLVAAHDGHVEVDSPPRQGATFRILLPPAQRRVHRAGAGKRLAGRPASRSARVWGPHMCTTGAASASTAGAPRRYSSTLTTSPATKNAADHQ
ncbi:hypothetical protein ACIHIX_34290 [Streptomyces sp. NPDC051913]|uniref:hypothetical protein n=1 Tax=Streptomyces sp. NPDC051913 TaxID=3365676 RepID=UPI0037D664AB